MKHVDFFPRNCRRIVPKSTGIRGFLVGVFVAGIVIPAAHGIVHRDDTDESDHLALAEDFPSAGMISNNGGIRGSGVLIHEQWVLTAAHLDGTPNEFTIGGSLYTISEFIRHPDWDNVEDGDDLALARLSASVTEAAPSPWFTGDDQTGVEGVSVGFGRTGTGLTGQVAGTEGVKRAGENTITGVGAAVGGGPPFGFQRPESAFEYEFNAPGDPEVLPLEGMAVLYDSGGPFFIDVEGQWEVAGIHSYVLNSGGDLGTYGDIVGSTRVSQYDEWITATIPEPSSVALLAGAGVVGLAFARRRWKTR